MIASVHFTKVKVTVHSPQEIIFIWEKKVLKNIDGISFSSFYVVCFDNTV